MPSREQLLYWLHEAAEIEHDLTCCYLSMRRVRDPVCEAVSLSPFHFARSFKSTIGLAPHRFGTLIRLQRAEELLVRTPMSVADVAAAVGYSNVNHFQ